MNNNIFRCRVCGRFGMAEEENLHECRALKDYEFEEDVIRVFDGKSWYPLNLEKVRWNLAEEKCSKNRSKSKSNRKFTDDESNLSLDGTRNQISVL